MRVRVGLCLGVLCWIAACADDEVGSIANQASALDSDAQRSWEPGEDRVFPERLDYLNGSGVTTTLNLGGPTQTLGHPFFTPLGDNTRACITCHQPADGMALSVSTIQAAWRLHGASHPLFEAIDGSNCPDLPQDQAESHSLLLEHGLFRIERPWPPRDDEGHIIPPEFDIEVVRDPAGCNRDPHAISVYRRPRPAANLRFATTAGFAFDPKNGLPLALDPETDALESGNLLADVRTRTLTGQALDALVSHMEWHGSADSRLLRRLVAFEQQLYTAQSLHYRAGDLEAAGATGGPRFLAEAPAGALQSAARDPIWGEFIPWDALPEPSTADYSPRQAFRKSVARGALLFSQRTFLVSDTAGLTDTGFGNPVRNSCAFCHNMKHAGLDVAPGQVDLGTTNQPYARQTPTQNRHLPLFRLTCARGMRPHAHLGRVVYTSDPGYALTTGRCVDIGKITAQSLRGLAARAPYFANGSARTLREVVDFYDTRFSIELTEQEKQDLTHLLEVL